MTADEALTLIDELEKLALEASRWALRDAGWHAKARNRAVEICLALRNAPGPSGLVDEKVTSILGNAEELFDNSTERAADLANLILMDCSTLRDIVRRAKS